MNSSYLRSYWLSAYLFATAGDWLQGPYLYSVYHQRGFSDSTITHLSGLGFLSSALLGALIASKADTGNRQRYALMTILAYAVSCGLLVLGGTSIWLLALGKLASGIATALWMPFFETWLVAQQLKHKLETKWLDATLSLAASLNGVIAIGAGFAGDALLLWWNNKVEMPFIVALMAFTISALIIYTTWPSNELIKHNNSSKASKASKVSSTWRDLLECPSAIYLCAIQVLFESAMYTFVYFWAPILQQCHDANDALPFGRVFAIFMVFYAIGPLVYRRISYKADQPMAYALLLASAALCLWTASYAKQSLIVTTSALAIFECHCGIYTPWAARLRAKFIPESMRGAATSLVTAPMNLIVTITLLLLGNHPNMALQTAVVMLLVAAYLATRLPLLNNNNSNKKE
ncbi:hypothetical protein BDF22DRAFT_743690 [Syncephalis plumigaleata]|nr:hypothetical protein BDF22DRAFT_743690 [Syncephalis plumigaleata]